MISLRKVDDKTYKLLRRWRNQNKEFFIYKNEISIEQHEKWYQSYKNKINDYCYIIYSDDVPVGTVSVVIESSVCMIERVMLGNKNYTRKGIMQKAIKKLIDGLSFNYYKLHVLRDNKAAISMYEKLEFFVIDEEKDIITMQRMGIKKK